MIALAATQALAQSCSCSVGTADATLPMGTVASPGAVQLALEYGIGQTGGQPWEGVVPATDRLGNSMTDMAMPGHLAQSARVAAAVGLPSGFQATATAPYVYSVPLYPSDMPGDVARGFVGDTSLGARWGARQGPTFVGTGLAATLPTGRVVRGVGVRGGRGAVGVVLDATALQMLVPVVGLGARLAWTQGLYASPIDGYLTGPQLDAVLGARCWTREQGKVSVVGLSSFVHRGHDRRGEDELEETGVDVVSVGLGTDWRAWSKEDRSLVISLRSLLPVFQVVGDPWLTENWTLSAGVALGL